MANDEEYDPNVGVPAWVNIVVPILGAIVFVLAMLFVYRTSWEVSIETLEDWVDKIPFYNRASIKKDDKRGDPNTAYKISRRTAPDVYRLPLKKGHQNRGFWDDTASIKSFGTMSGSDYYGSQVSTICFESQV